MQYENIYYFILMIQITIFFFSIILSYKPLADLYNIMNMSCFKFDKLRGFK